MFVDPRIGMILGAASGEALFRTVMDLHRWLALLGGPNGVCRQITGFAALSLIILALSGPYLRSPLPLLGTQANWRAR